MMKSYRKKKNRKLLTDISQKGKWQSKILCRKLVKVQRVKCILSKRELDLYQCFFCKLCLAISPLLSSELNPPPISHSLSLWMASTSALSSRLSSFHRLTDSSDYLSFRKLFLFPQLLSMSIIAQFLFLLLLLCELNLVGFVGTRQIHKLGFFTRQFYTHTHV